jgi:hypothetical protein
MDSHWGETMKKRKKKKKSKKTAGRGIRRKKQPRKAPRKKSPAKAKAAVRKKTGKRPRLRRKPARKEGYVVESLVGLEKEPRAPAGLMTGDLQGLSNTELVDSESVDELLEEGNAFEAGVVAGVEEAEERGVKEVRTKEIPVEDVPGEYLDED